MATPKPKWQPHPSGWFRRGLDVSGDKLNWAFVREGDTRKTTVFLNQPGLRLTSTDEKVATAKYGKGSTSGRYHVWIIPHSTGKATIRAWLGGFFANLDVLVAPERSISVAFRRINSGARKSNLTTAKADRLLKAASLIYRYQGNFKFQRMGGVDRINIAGPLPATVNVNDLISWDSHCLAQVTVYFVWENDALGGNWKDRIVMEDSQRPPFDEMTMAHELGHFFSLPHPTPPLPSNLMNQTNVGDRHRYRVNLTRAQIEKITSLANWNQPDWTIASSTCSVTKILERAFTIN